MTNVITSVFDINSINYLLTEESTYRQHIDHYPLIFCTVNSIVNDFTIFSAIYLKNNKDFVIVGADINIQKNHDEQYSLLINHIISLRKIPSLCNIKIIFIPEKFAPESGRIKIGWDHGAITLDGGYIKSLLEKIRDINCREVEQYRDKDDKEKKGIQE
ncbi:hypothetical protein LCGC14_2400230 [marine sediment metagenome]|uniref:Uncharacterized protein n=1 Tax=marine sediment metagenome TaxID=412755 RepID=A0A0F9EPZ8_9ZZZZ